IITAQRIPFLEIGLEEGVLLEGVQIVADGNANAPINELATVSARSFSVEETERIAASVNDMGRMALSFPGVQQGGDDTENDIIIRGNSSVGMLWRLEGIDIPNPNHFARPGTSGGGITVFSSQLLSKSDFYTGGMPAEFGNAISGAFDVHFRKGNMLDRQHRVRIGLLGLDFATEGPLSKGKSSYLINYRYSTLGLLNKMG
ncbi:MAG: TonB-dependent receptor plug domain-containing protein, partial [Saprospiraceae bacterium]|nr:TonB-dependent receptor plug domain-containing protein [Saprospiraceae bacterium]